MNDAQTWTVLGGFLAVVVAMSTMLLRIVRTEVSSLHTEIEASRVVTESRFDGVDRRLDGVDRRLDRVEHRLDGLDSDVQTLTRRVFGIDEGQ